MEADASSGESVSSASASESEAASEPEPAPEPEPLFPPPPDDSVGKKRSGGGKSRGPNWVLRLVLLLLLLGLGAAYWFVVVEPALAEREEMILYLNRVEGLAFSPDSTRLAVGTEMGDMGILDIPGGNYLSVFPSTHPEGGLQSLGWGDKGLLAVGFRDGSKGIVELWRVNTQGTRRKRVRVLSWKPSTKDRLQEVASFLGFTPNGKFLVVFDATGNMVRAWDAWGRYAPHNPNRIGIGTAVKATSLDTGGYHILAGVTRKGTVLLWGKNEYKPKAGTSLVRRSGDNWTGATNVMVAPDGSWVAYDTATGGDEWHRSLIFHPIKGGSDRVVHLNEFGCQLRSACVSLDGKYVAVSLDNRVLVLESSSGNQVYSGEVPFRTVGSAWEYVLDETLDLIDFL